MYQALSLPFKGPGDEATGESSPAQLETCIVAVVIREGNQLCLMSLEPAMEPDSLWRDRTMS